MANPKDKILPGSDKFYSPDMTDLQKLGIMRDPATELAQQRGQHLEIYHIPSGQSIKFKAYINDFQDKYDSTWNSADVYGRMDPIQQYQGTKRVISLDWTIPSYSIAEAKFNHDKCGLLFSMLYPNYNVDGSGRSSATQISTAPIFKIKFGNLIQDPSATDDGGAVEDTGLVGAISGFTYAPNVEAGFIDNINQPGTLYPKEVKLAMDYTVMHTHGLGWDRDQKRQPRFPYNQDAVEYRGIGGRSNTLSRIVGQDVSTLTNLEAIETILTFEAEKLLYEVEQDIIDGILGR